MDKNEFWQIIDTARKAAGSWQDMYIPLLEALSMMEPEDIIHWQQILNEYEELSMKTKLWAAASAMRGGCSDDGFDYFRGWLIAQGKDVFLKALAEPDSLADHKAVQIFAREVRRLEYTPLKGYKNDASFEKILYIASYAYENRTGNKMDFYDRQDANPLSDKEKAEISAEITYAADIDVKWFEWEASQDEEDQTIQKLVPRIHHLFNGGK